MERLNQGLSAVIKVGVLGLISVGIWVGVKVGNRIDAVDKLLTKSNDTLLQVSRTAQTIQATTKSFQEQFDDQSTILARKNAQLALTAAVQHTAFVTLPKVDGAVENFSRSVEEVSDAASRTLGVVSDSTLPAITQTVLTTELETKEVSAKVKDVSERIAVQYLADSHEVAENVNKLLREGAVSVADLDKAVVSLTGRTETLLDNSNAITHNVAETTKSFPAMAEHARRWQPLMTGARLVALILGVFTP
jgi:hypothetical protein